MIIIDYNNAEILKYAVENGMLDVSSIKAKIDMKNRREYLSMHSYEIWQGKNGFWYTYLPNEEKGRVLRKRNTELGIEDVIVEYWKIAEENPTVEEIFNEWNDRRKELNKICNATHTKNKQIFKKHYSEFRKKRIKSIESDDISDFLEEQIPKYNMTSKAFSNLKSITRGWVRRAKKRKFINIDVNELFDNIDVSDHEFRKIVREDYEEVFDEEETPIIMNYLEKNLDVRNAVILLIFVTGLRVGEITTLKPNDLNSTSIKVRRTETIYKDCDGNCIVEVKEHPKTDAGLRTIYVPEEWHWLLKKVRTYNPFGEFVFINQSGERLTSRSIRGRLYRVCLKLNIFPKSPHKIRKTYGTILLDSKVDERLILDQMGHTEVLCTENYYHRNRKNSEKKIQILSKIEDFKRVAYK